MGQAIAPHSRPNLLPSAPCSRTIDCMAFRERLQRELDLRRAKNPRYSIRALALFLGADHSTLAQILRGARRVPVGQIRRWAKKLAISPEETAAYTAAEHAPDQRTVARQRQLQHWTAEAMAVTSEPAHWRILQLCRAPGFRQDCRWIAVEIGVSVDQVNVALSRLLRLRLLQVNEQGEWKAAARLTEREFRRTALARVRKESKEWQTQ